MATAPTDGTPVILFGVGSINLPNVVQGVFDPVDKTWWPDCWEYQGDELNPTGWTHLPDPPDA